MTLDSLAVLRLCDELQSSLTGARIDKVLHPAENTVALDLYGRMGRAQLVLSASPQAPAVFLTRERLGRQDDRTSPFLLLCRKYLRGGRIRAIAQLDFDRVLVFDVEQIEDGKPRRTRLVAELTGRLANLVLLDEQGEIYDALRRVPGTINRVRTLLPHDRYQPPPVSKPAIDALDEGSLRLLDRTRAGESAWRVAVDTAAGVSPLLAREAVYRCCGDAAATVPDASMPEVFDTIQTLIESVAAGRESPSGAWEGDLLVAFAPYELRHLPNVRPADSISNLVEVSFEQGAIPAGIEARRERLRDRLDSMIGRERRIESDLSVALERAQEADRLRLEGELILGFQHQIEPGQTVLAVEGMEIALDPDRSPVEQAQERFQRYRKLQSMESGLPERLQAVQARLEWLETLRVHALAAQTAEDLSAIEAEIETGAGAQPNWQKAQRRSSAKVRAKPGRDRSAGAAGRVQIEGWDVLYGRSARQNAQVTFSLASPADLWLHARGVPGAHVVLRTAGQTPPDEVIEAAAAFAAWLSAARESPKVEVDVTEVRHVRKRPGGAPGLVTYRNERTLIVRPASVSEDAWHTS